MPFISTPGAFSWALAFDLWGQAVQVTQDFLTGVEITRPYLEDTALAIANSFNDTIMADLSQQLETTAILAASLENATAPSVEIPYGPHTGSITAGTPFPGNAALCVKKVTNKRGRGFRGRMYLPGLSSDSCEEGNFNVVKSAYLVALLADYATWIANLGGVDATLSPCVIHKFSGIDPDTHRPIPLSVGQAEIVTGYTCNNQIDSQRRRLAGRGT